MLPRPDERSNAIKVQIHINKNEIGRAADTFKTKLRIVPRLSKYIFALSSVYLFEYFINQGTVSRFFV